MRDPYAVVRSVMAKGFLQDGHWDPYDLYVEEHRPDIVEPRDHLGRAIRYVALWDEPISERVPLLRARDYDEWRHLGSVWGALLHVTGKEHDRGKVINTPERLGTRTDTKMARQAQPTVASAAQIGQTEGGGRGG